MKNFLWRPLFGRSSYPPTKIKCTLPVLVLTLFCFLSPPSFSQLSCPDTTYTCNVYHGLCDGLLQQQSCQTPKIRVVDIQGLVPDNVYGNYCNGHTAPSTLDVWVARTCEADDPTCKWCSTVITLWYWDLNQSQWIYNPTYIDGNGDLVREFVFDLPGPPTGACGTCCIEVFLGHRDGSSYCAQLSNDCFNSGSITYQSSCVIK